MNIYPAFLTENIFELREQLSRLDGLTDQISGVHVDIIDGEFADNLTVSPIDMIGTDFGGLMIDFHLMVNDPANFIYECRQAEHVRAVIGQIEHMHSQFDFIQEVKELNMKPGLSIDLYTPVDSIRQNVWEDVQVIQLMGVKAGAQDQPYGGGIVLKKIVELIALRKKFDASHVEIMIDGGVTPTTLPGISKAGADSIVVGSFLWESDDVAQAIDSLQSS